VASGRLMFTYSVNGASQFYYVPVGMEDSLFGSGSSMKITIKWDGSTCRLFLNDIQVQFAPYSKPSPNWSSSSNFDIGAQEYLMYGGYNALDDIISEFTVTSGQ
jgi:hypothetical protein